jgi:threonine dehydrogenase-like Zn-dependent dehydrogenase
VVFEATGHPAALDGALALAAFEGRVVVVSNYGARRAPVDLGPRFHRRRLRLISSQVSTVAPSHRARWDSQRRFRLVTELLAELPLEQLVDRRVLLDDTPALFAELDRAAGAPSGEPPLAVIIDHRPSRK